MSTAGQRKKNRAAMAPAWQRLKTMIETQLTPVRLTMGAAVEFILLFAAEILAGDQAAEANGCEKVSLCTIARVLGYRIALV